MKYKQQVVTGGNIALRLIDLAPKFSSRKIGLWQPVSNIDSHSHAA